jgi:predicted transcriptional regulator
MPKKKIAPKAHDDEALQSRLDIAAAADAREGIRQGLEDAEKGRGKPAREFFKEFEAKYGLSR